VIKKVMVGTIPVAPFPLLFAERDDDVLLFCRIFAFGGAEAAG
jgi:hypothetical protein